MNKTWRASDILILLLLALMALFVGLQMLEATRLHERMNESVAIGLALRDRQNDVDSRLEKLEKAIGKLKTARVVAPSGQSVPSADGDASPAENEVAEAAKRGGTLILHCGSRIRTLNPLTYKDVDGGAILSHLYDEMITRDPDTLEWKPRLAESWTVSDDKLTYEFTLREGLRWSDGQPLTTEDVVFSYETIMNPAVDAARIASYYKDVESVTALDARRVRFKFKKPYFLSLTFAGGITIIPKHVYAFEGKEGALEFNGKRQPTVFSGQYMIEKWDEAVEIVLRRNDRYYGTPGYHDRIVYRIVEDPSSALQMLKAGKLDFMELRAEQYMRLKEDADFLERYRLLKYPSPGAGYSYIGWNQGEKASDLFKDRRVRLALTYLTPREQMLHDILYDLGEVATGPFWPGVPGTKVQLQSDPSIKPYPYDQERAMGLLTQAGWRDTDGDGVLDKNGRPLAFKLMVPSASTTGIEIANRVRESMAKVGIRMEVETVEWTVFTKKLDDRTFDACLLGWGGGVESDPYQIWHSDSIANGGSNHIGFSNAEADRLIVEARGELDVAKRTELFHRFHQIVHREQPYTFLFSRPELVAVSKNVEGVTVHALGLDSREWWTPADRRRDGE